jgi:hypothetical protein
VTLSTSHYFVTSARGVSCAREVGMVTRYHCLLIFCTERKKNGSLTFLTEELSNSIIYKESLFFFTP